MKQKDSKRSKVLFVGDSVSHSANFNSVEIETGFEVCPTKAYSSVRDVNARFPDKNVKDVVENELKKDEYSILVLGAPSVDITNLRTEKITVNDDIEMFKEKIKVSCENMLDLAHSALVTYPKLQKVVLLEHCPRMDSKNVDPTSVKPFLARFANRELRKLCSESPLNEKIVAGSNKIHVNNVNRKNILQYDGIHLTNHLGAELYTKSVIK